MAGSAGVQRVPTTVAAVGSAARAAVERLGASANVRAVETWREVAEVHAPSALHDADPLQRVVDAEQLPPRGATGTWACCTPAPPRA